MTTFRLARSPVANIVGSQRVLGAFSWAQTNEPPSWGSAAGAIFNIPQGGTLNLHHALRFTDPENDPLIITQVAGSLPAGTTYNQATGIITAGPTATLGLTGDLVFQADDGQQSIKIVGPGKPYPTIRSAILAAQDGDIINIDGGDYIGDVATLTANNVLIRGVSTTNRARLLANGVHQSDKGIIVLEGDNCTFENMEFHDAEGPSGNIAGIRLDGAGLTTIRNCGFYDCENGILSGGNGTVLLELCEFARNGFGDGTTHNVYFGQHQMVTARDCYFHEAKIGHEFKSRAKENILERCYFVNGPTGTASYGVNADNGGKLVMRGCMLHKGPNADNSNMIFHNTNTWGASFNSILLEHCTLVHDEAAGAFINLASGSTTVTLTACLFASNGRPLVTGATPVQNSNFHTVVASIPGASNVVDPDFWPISSIHQDLDIPGGAVVPTYLIDEPNIFQPRTLTTPPIVIGSIQNALVFPGALPAWVQIPSQADELVFYDDTFGVGSGKEVAWTYTAVDVTPNVNAGGFGTPALPSFIDVHNETEADDLWNHYQQYKRTNEQRYMDWAVKWRDYYVSPDYEADLRATCFVPATWHHLYLQGLCLWGKEQNDSAAIAQAEYLMGIVEPDSLAQVPGASNMSGVESRNYGRRLINACWVSMVAPTSRWITLRDHLIDCWVQSSGWRDTTHATQPTIIGGNHFCFQSSVQAGWTPTQGAQGLRFNHSFNMGIHNEALWLAYKLTGRADVKNMIIQMARFVLHYGWDPLHPNAFVGARWGYRPLTGAGAAPSSLDGKSTPGFLHQHVDEYIDVDSDDPRYGVPQPAPYPTLMDPAFAPTSNYEIAMVNGLVYAYKLTGEMPFLKRAREHLRKATQYRYASQVGSINPKLSDTEMEHCLDTKRDAVAAYLFSWNKGENQYASYVFENGGNPSLEP